MDDLAIHLISNFIVIDHQPANFVVAEPIQPFSEAWVNQKLIGRSRKALNHLRRRQRASSFEERVQARQVPQPLAVPGYFQAGRGFGLLVPRLSAQAFTAS